MSKAPTSVADDTAGGDIATNSASFAFSLRADAKSPMTIKSYLEAVRQLDAFLAGRGMPRQVAHIRRERPERDWIALARTSGWDLSEPPSFSLLSQFGRAALEETRQSSWTTIALANVARRVEGSNGNCETGDQPMTILAGA